MIADLTDCCGSFASDMDTLASAVLVRIQNEPARVVTDARGRITSINPAFSAICGYTFEEVRGKKPGDFLQGPETDNSSVEKLRKAIRNRTDCTATMVNYHKDGSTYPVRIELKPFFKKNGALAGFRAAEWRIP
jgi:PAS domain S-box-containing protein